MRDLIVAIGMVFAGAFSAGLAVAKQLSGGPISGVVVDQKTRAPVVGAMVIAEWILHFQGHSSWHACYHAEVTTTDVNGRYVIPKWKAEVKPTDPPLYRDWTSWWRGSDMIFVYAHSPKYRYSSGGHSGSYEVRMVDPDASPSQKIETWRAWVSNYGQCLNGPTMAAALRRIHANALQIAENDEQRSFVQRMLHDIDVAEVGWDEAKRRLADRERARSQR